MDRKQVPAASWTLTNAEQSQQEEEELPPAYTTSHNTILTASQSTTTWTPTPTPAIDYASYRPPQSIISSDRTTITTANRLYCKDPKALAGFIRQQASLPPRPFLRVRGSVNGASYTDFDLKINLLPYLYRAGDDSWNYLSIQSSRESIEDQASSSSATRRPFSRRSASGHRSLETWCHEFVKEASSIKTFTLTRTMINFDLPTLSGLIRNTFADSQYRAQLEITLESSFSKVVVDNQPTKGASAFFRPLVSAFVGSKDYDVVTAVWPWARSGPNDDSSELATGRDFASLSEAAWWKQWKIAVMHAAMDQRSGWVSSDDRIEAAMTGWATDSQIRPWGNFARA